jgi:hypothetical protein
VAATAIVRDGERDRTTTSERAATIANKCNLRRRRTRFREAC